MEQYIIIAIISSLVSVLVFAIISLTQQKTGTYLPMDLECEYVINTKTGKVIRRVEEGLDNRPRMEG